MLMSHAFSDECVSPKRRRAARYAVQCRARIQIGRRYYAGYIHDISTQGARLRTITAIRKLGKILLKLPDQPPIHCKLSWTDAYNAGVSFELPLGKRALREWVGARSVCLTLNEAECEETVV